MIPESVYMSDRGHRGWFRELVDEALKALTEPRRKSLRTKPEREHRDPVEHYNRRYVQIVGCWSARERR